MMPEERARTNTSAQIRFGADANIPIATLGWVDPRQEVSVTPEERAVEALNRIFLPDRPGATVHDFRVSCGSADGVSLLDGIADAIRAAVAEAREEDVRNHRERLREWLAAHGVQSVKGESMLETGWRAAIAEEREACIRDVWAGDLSHPAAIEARIRARGQA